MCNRLYRVAETDKMPYLASLSPQIIHHLLGSFAENNL